MNTIIYLQYFNKQKIIIEIVLTTLNIVNLMKMCAVYKSRLPRTGPLMLFSYNFIICPL